MKKIRNFFAPHVTFTIQDCDINLLNRLREFRPKRISFANGTLCLNVPLLYKKRVQQIVRNMTYTITEQKSIVSTFSFLYVNIGLIACFAVMIVALSIFNMFVFRIQIQGIDGQESAELRAFLRDNNVNSFTRKGRVNQGISTKITSNFDFIAHTSTYIRGNTMVISVHRTQTPPLPPMTDLVSSHDAIITEILVLSGIAQVDLGDAVVVGQILVSAALQIGVEPGEPDDWGRPTFTKITVPGYATALIRGRVSHSRTTTIQDQSQKDAASAQLLSQIKSQTNAIEFESVNTFINPLPDGTFSVEVVASKIIDLVNSLNT
ncbi:MAG: sporulation protein YqfD [Firmicutes bacterium]|nr:sporulation protein YqfD [Bacillota bacterium]